MDVQELYRVFLKKKTSPYLPYLSDDFNYLCTKYILHFFFFYVSVYLILLFLIIKLLKKVSIRI
jgi:hypothetical protein